MNIITIIIITIIVIIDITTRYYCTIEHIISMASGGIWMLTISIGPLLRPKRTQIPTHLPRHPTGNVQQL